MKKLKKKVAERHLEPCEITDCKFAHSLRDSEPVKCCFGLRHEGCIYFNREMQHHLGILASVEARLTEAKYEAGPYWAARTRNDQIDFPEVENLIEPVMEKVAKITGKVYNFIYKGHEYTYQDNSMDFKSCPHCDRSNKHEFLGYYGEGQGRIACFECGGCFENFYYHKPE